MSRSADGVPRSRLAEVGPSVWAQLGLVPELELHAGHQSRVFLALGREGRLIVKMTEAGDGSEAVRRRVELTRRLAAIDPAVVGPVNLNSDLVIEAGPWLVVCYPYVDGTSPKTTDRRDVEAMAVTLSTLHASLAGLNGVDLPSVAALSHEPDGPLGEGHVIHGDFAEANLIVTPSGFKVIDFDDCGHGSVEFEIGNSLYMVLFDAWDTGDLDRYQNFRSWFVDRYRSAASRRLDDALLDEAIRVRARALGRWLAEPSTAPSGIRTASTAWRERLQSFVEAVASGCAM